jgi:urease accessory protein
LIGRVAIAADRRGAETVLTELAGTAPWRPKLLRGGPTARVVLVQTCAGLLSGDEVELSVTVAADAVLELSELAATIAHDARGGPPARLRVRIEVASGGRFSWAGEPLIVAAGAALTRTTTVSLAAGACALLGEPVVLGRAGEQPGALRAHTRITGGGRPLVDELLDTADHALLRSPLVAGAAGAIWSLTLAGVRDPQPPPGTMQAHGPATLWRALGCAADPDPAALALARRWRELTLLGPACEPAPATCALAAVSAQPATAAPRGGASG